MSLKEQLSKIVEVAKLTEEVAYIASENIRLGTLANTILDCPDLLNQIKALLVGEGAEVVAEVAGEPGCLMSNIGEINFNALKVHLDKLHSAISTLRSLIRVRQEGVGPADDLGEIFDAIHKIVANIPKPGPTVDLVVKVEASTESAASLVAEAIERGSSWRKFHEYPEDTYGFTSAPGYEQLVQVFAAAHDQAAYGKGKERHANGLPFHEQRMQGISDLVGSPDGMLYQLVKKTTEGLQFDSPEKREHELLGALNYLAGIVIWLRRHDAVKPVEG